MLHYFEKAHKKIIKKVRQERKVLENQDNRDRRRIVVLTCVYVLSSFTSEWPAVAVDVGPAPGQICAPSVGLQQCVASTRTSFLGDKY